MNFPNFLSMAAALVVRVAAVLTKRQDYPVIVSTSAAPSYQPASDLHNVSSYLALTRVNGSISQLYKEAYRNGHFEKNALSLTTSFGNSQGFYTPIQLGGDTFDLLVDTGSSDTWILREDAKCLDPTTGLPVSGPVCNFGPEWNPSGCVPIANENFNIEYGGAPNDADQGTFCTIDVTIGGVTAKNQQVAAVTQAAYLGYAPSSGVLGLAYPDLTYAFHGTNFSADNLSINQAPYDPVFTTMYKQHNIPPIFSVALSRPSTQYVNDGFVAFGGLPPVATYGSWGSAPIQYVAINSSGYNPTILPYPQYQWYTITPDAFLFEGSDKIIYDPTQWAALPGPSGPQGQYLLDTGATQLYLAPAIADAIASKFSPPATWDSYYGFYSVPCNASAPWFAVKIGGVVFPVDKRDMVIDDQTGRGTCMTGVNDGMTYAPYTLGDVFLNNVVVAFDVGAGEVRMVSRGSY